MCPIYEYYCEKCNTTIEIIHRREDVSTIVCDNCLYKLEKIISRCGVRLIGDGFYKPSTGDKDNE